MVIYMTITTDDSTTMNMDIWTCSSVVIDCHAYGHLYDSYHWCNLFGIFG